MRSPQPEEVYNSTISCATKSSLACSLWGEHINAPRLLSPAGVTDECTISLQGNHGIAPKVICYSDMRTLPSLLSLGRLRRFCCECERETSGVLGGMQSKVK